MNKLKLFFGRLPLLVWFLIPTIVIVGIGVWYFSVPGNHLMRNEDDKPVPVARDVEGTQYFDIVGRSHIASGTPGSGYNSNPPTSGNHWGSPAKAGIYDKQLPDEQLIHNLEHGYVWISYRPGNNNAEASAGAGQSTGVSEDVINELKKIVEADNWKVILEPREKNDKVIALAAWGRLLNLDNPDYDKVKDFIKTYRNRGPEKTPE